MPITRKELDAQPGCVQVICYHTAHKPPRLFHVEMPDQSKTIWFWAADEFKDFTNWPERGQEIYDIYQGKFIPLHTGATYPKCAWYPHFITKPVALPERDCFELVGQIEQLIELAMHLPPFIPTWLREPEPEPPRRLTPQRFLEDPFEVDGTRKRKRENTPEVGSDEWCATMDAMLDMREKGLGIYGRRRPRSTRRERKYGKTPVKRV
ncbi:hypothetical protein D9756_010194 [Leucocoprinus leucothites]|uniref:Uncharacterized protein n=1 Tax=Leucocoprinus leucothites TaxID=201217 RepID=A0A8H5CU45_9AGAR|nr:hypothetical protein D9756_010194 [Leucoagaricus leucothites]